jgi:hypothetical protein
MEVSLRYDQRSTECAFTSLTPSTPPHHPSPSSLHFTFNVFHFAIFMNAYNDLFIFTLIKFPFLCSFPNVFPPQTGPLVKILENNHDIKTAPSLGGSNLQS